jgi:hypothetical protein
MYLSMVFTGSKQALETGLCFSLRKDRVELTMSKSVTSRMENMAGHQVAI